MGNLVITTKKQRGKKTMTKKDYDVSLKHVETKKQDIDEEEVSKLRDFQEAAEKELGITHEKLSTEENSILASFLKTRMILQRIFITLNQSRNMMGLEVISEKDLKKHLEHLVKLDYMTYEEVDYQDKINEVYILTEKGKEATL